MRDYDNPTILDRLSDESVIDFYINKQENNVRLIEACDNYYYIDLSKSELNELITELQKISLQLKDSI